KESESKLRARSRFSAAFRSLSKPKSKKSKPQEQQPEAVTEPAVQLVSSGAEDVTSLGEGVPKKKSLTRRLLQAGGLRKGVKVRPHSLATSDDISVLSSSQERVERPSPSGSTLQITISGKKVETSTRDRAGAGSKSRSKSKTKSETYYLTAAAKGKGSAAAAPATTAAAATATDVAATTTPPATATTTTATHSRTRSTRLIVSKVCKEPATAPRQKPSAVPAVAQHEEKIVITASRRDTPPRERAPAKPSRAPHAVQSVSSSGAVRNVSREQQQQQQLMQQQQRGHRLASRTNHSISSSFSGSGSTTATPVISVQALQTPTTSEQPIAPLLSLSDVEEQTDAVSLAESAGTSPTVPAAVPVPASSPVPSLSPAPVQVRFAVGSAVRGPAAAAYEAALAAAASQQPSSSEEPSDSSLRRLSFAAQQNLSDHDSIEGRRETLRYQSVASEYSDSRSEEEDGEQREATAAAVTSEERGKQMPAFGNLTMDQQMEPTIMAPSSEKREHLYKILVIGELGTGKTSFIKRYVHQFFSQNYRATIGVDFALKVLHWDANTIVRLQLWDIAGQERFGNMTRVYYKEAVGAFIVFDVTRSGTFDCVSKWKEDLDSKVQLPDGSPIPCILLANKCDQDKQGIVTQPERMDEYVRENGFAGWFETSAKENINIDEAARALVNKILINDKLIAADASDGDKFNLNASDAPGTGDGKPKCSC
ncbi:hypothetical protein KR222_004518, partial [Zaprionus bogoriensis]